MICPDATRLAKHMAARGFNGIHLVSLNIYNLFMYITGSAAHKKLVEMLTRPRLIAVIRKLSKYHQTSGLEAKPSMDNVLASKNTYHSYHSLSAR